MPRLHVDDNPNLVSPGVKWGVQPGSFTHCTELFGPVLGVMEARDLDEAIELVNATGYGLTSGLESLDDREHEHVARADSRRQSLHQSADDRRDRAAATVRRHGQEQRRAGDQGGRAELCGAADASLRKTGRQGEGETRRRPQMSASTSATHLADWRISLQTCSGAEAESAEQLDADEVRRVLAAIDSYAEWGEAEFRAAHDHFRLLGEDNFRRYLPVEPLRIRVHADDTLFDVFCRAAAARAAGCRATISVPPSLAGPAAEAVELLDRLTDSWAGAIEFVEEDDAQLAEAIRAGQWRGCATRRRTACRRRFGPRRRKRCNTWPIRRCRRTAASSCCGTSASRACRTCIIATAILGIRADEPRDEPQCDVGPSNRRRMHYTYLKQRGWRSASTQATAPT